MIPRDTSRYDHLNRDQTIPFDMDTLARQIVDMNYGCVRLLYALVRARSHRPPMGHGPQPRCKPVPRPDRLSDGIRDLLENGDVY